MAQKWAQPAFVKQTTSPTIREIFDFRRQPKKTDDLHVFPQRINMDQQLSGLESKLDVVGRVVGYVLFKIHFLKVAL